MTTQMKAAAAILTCIAIVAGGALLLMNRTPVKISNGVVLCDNSGSIADDKSSCLGLVERALKRPKLAKGATLTVLTLGDIRTGGEPRFIAKYDIGVSRRAVEGKKKFVKQQAELLSDLRNQLDAVPRTDRSPIFIAVKRGIEQLRGTGCPDDAECFLFIRTDGEETSESSIRRAIDAGTAKAKGLPAPLDHSGIKVIFCGLAENDEAATSDRINTRRLHTPAHVDRIREIWLSLFTLPDLVSFEPYCPKVSAPEIAEK